MSHELEIKPDGTASAFFVGQPAWHGLGTVLVNPPSVEEALVAAGLDWKVKLAPIFHQKPLEGSENPNDVQYHSIPEFQATVRESDGKVLGVVGKKFVPLQNVTAFQWFEPFVDSGAVTLEAAGALKEGKRVWVLAKLKASEGGVEEIVPGDKVEQFILLAHAHDGSLAIRIGFTSVRVVCQNTLTAAISDNEASKLLKIRHTSYAPVALAVVREIIDTTRREFAANADVFRILAATGCDELTLRKYVREVFEPGSGEKDEVLPRLVNNIVELFQHGKGAELGRGTLWNAYNSITEHVTHFQARSQDNRLDSQWFGKGASIIKRALEVATALALK